MARQPTARDRLLDAAEDLAATRGVTATPAGPFKNGPGLMGSSVAVGGVRVIRPSSYTVSQTAAAVDSVFVSNATVNAARPGQNCTLDDAP